MASDYPGGLDSFDTIASDKKTSDAVGGRTHRDMHNDLGDAIEAVQTELGTNPSGGSATVKARFEVIEANDWVTAARIAADAVGSSEIAADAVGSSELADNAVDTAAIADGAVTPAKMATTGRFTFPTGAANGYGFTSGASHLSGTGAPEGVVTAAPGSTWLQTDSTTDVKGWIRWIKATGTGNTGWVAGPEADTGWRDVTPAAPTGWTTLSYIKIRRRGDEVEVRIGGTTDTAGLGSLYAVPTGYSPGAAAAAGAAVLFNGGSGASVASTSLYFGSGSGILTAYRPASTAVFGAVKYQTNQAWPTSLPGSAA